MPRPEFIAQRLEAHLLPELVALTLEFFEFRKSGIKAILEQDGYSTDFKFKLLVFDQWRETWHAETITRPNF